jgi:transcriptional regulator with XRE-family HTH domain
MRVALTALARRREEVGLMQKELASLCHMAPATLSAVENGWQTAWPKLRRDCSRILGQTEEELFPPGEALRTFGAPGG